MKNKKSPSKVSPKKFWWIYNQEEIPVAVCWAKTKGGAFAKFEEQTEEDREGYTAVEFTFNDGCSVAVEAI